MIRWTRRAEKDVAELPERLAERARSLAGQLEKNPVLGSKLKGNLKGKWSARLGRSHRIIYTVDEGQVTILTVRPRRDAYR